MRAVWKWIIGILVVLVVLAAIVGGAWVLRNHFAAMPHRIVQVGPRTYPAPNAPNSPNTPNSPNVPNGQNPYYGQGPYYYGGPMMPYGRHGYEMPMMRGRGFGLLGPILGLIGFLFFVGIVVLIVLVVLALVRRTAHTGAVIPPVAAATTAAAATTHACPNCGQPVQDGFEYCPHCGAKQQ